MSQTPNDPAGTTHQFQNFANQAQPKSGPNVGMIVGIVAVVAVVVVLAVAVLMMM
ncbi:hypothetical protein [Actinomadura darangshiensis]|uniref:hypothetical protein n=1 Tax=Actinomadura darangshiensis TaxID=705336 RepID=UPI00140C7471|nr:hypothetical protein [Actinomadura darangshiensis]